MRKHRSAVPTYILKIAMAVFFCTGLFWRCANQMAPQGGPVDTLPPVVVNMTPSFGTRNFTGRRIMVEFDEYVKLQDLQKEFFTSPGMKRMPSATIRGRGIQIDIHPSDTLRENTTYAFNFGSSVRDNNEGNPLNNFRYVFSTGDHIDSLVMSGYTADAYRGDSVSKTFILFFDAALDSIPGYDSTIFKHKPDAIARAQSNGIFLAENLKEKDYRIYAYQDANFNHTYDPGTDMVGFLDSIYNPTLMPDFDAWYDTIRRYVVADPQLYFRMFKDQASRRQVISKQSRDIQNRLTLVFGAPYPDIRNLTFLNVDSTRIITEYARPTRDSVLYWLDIPPADIPDTVKASITYMRHDSINNLIPHTQELRFGWKAFESRSQERERLAREKAREQAIAEGREPEKEPSKFKVTIGASNVVNPERNIPFVFNYPLSAMDSARIALTILRESDTIPVPVHLVRDTSGVRNWTLKADWVQGGNYRLTIPAGVFVDIAGNANDTLRSQFSVMEQSRYAKLKIEMTGKTPESRYVLELINSRGDVLDKIPHVATGNYTFNFVEPGSVQVRVIEDMNDNGEWDTGSLIERRQPERVETYMNQPGDPNIPTRVDWEITVNIDMNILFEPTTMQYIMRKIALAEQARLKKMMEAGEKNRNQRRTPENTENIKEFDNYNRSRTSTGSIPGMQGF